MKRRTPKRTSGNTGPRGPRGRQGRPGVQGPRGEWPLQTFDSFFTQVKRLADSVEALSARVAALEEFARSMPSLETRPTRTKDRVSVD